MYDSADHKRISLLGTLDLCPFAAINLTHPGVQAGMFLKTIDVSVEPLLRVRVGLNPAVMKIQDLLIDQTGFSGVFLIKGAFYSMFFPWDSVFVIEAFDAQGTLTFSGQWHDQFVQDLMAKALSGKAKPTASADSKPKLKRIK